MSWPTKEECKRNVKKWRRAEAKRISALRKAMKKPGYGEKVSKALKDYCKEHPEWRRAASRRMIGNKFGRANKGNSNCGKGSPRMKGHRHSEETKLKMSKSHPKTLPLAQRRKISISLRNSDKAKKARIKAVEAARACGRFGYPTRLEKKLMEILDGLGVKYKFDQYLEGYFPDFRIKGTNILLEADGEYWHRDKAKDQRRDRKLKSLGYNIVRFPGGLIEKYPEKVSQKIRKLVA